MSDATILMGAGDATAGRRVTNTTADKNFFEFRFESSHATGDGRGIYMRYYAKGAGIADCARFYASTEADGVGGIAGVHASAAIGTGKNGVTGLAVGLRGTADTAAAAAAAGGTMYGAIAETVTAADKGVGVDLAPLLIRCLGAGVKPAVAIVLGDAEGPLSTGTDATTAVNTSYTADAENMTASLQVMVNGAKYQIPMDPVA